MRPQPGVALRRDDMEEVAHRISGVAEVEAPAGNELRTEIDVAGDDVGAGVGGIGVDGDRQIAGLAVMPAFARDQAVRVQEWRRRLAGAGPGDDPTAELAPARGPERNERRAGAAPNGGGGGGPGPPPPGGGG